MNEVTCPYCAVTFTAKHPNTWYRPVQRCSPECAKRDRAWETWIRTTRALAITGDPRQGVDMGPKLPAGGAGLAASVARFTQLNLLKAVGA